MGAVKLAKRSLDIGLFSDNPAMPDYYQHTLGLPFVEAIEHSATYQEMFFEVNGASLKINQSTEPMGDGVSGYCGLVIATDTVSEPQHLTDPDGLRIELVPVGYEGITQFGIICRVPDADRQRSFLIESLGAEEMPGGVRIGDIPMRLEEAPIERSTPTWRRGFNYYVVFAADGPRAHQQLLDAGAEHAVPPLKLMDRCVFSWVRDPSGNWIELVQYADIAGPLPEVDPIDQHWAEIVRWREDGVAFG